MTKGRRVGVAMIGAGFIADYHLAGLEATGRAHLPVLVTRRPAAAAALARRFAIPEVTADLGMTLARPDVEGVVIATPDDTHEPIALAAAKAGKAILLQKPMAPTAAACRRIIQAAREVGVDLQVSFMHRHFEEVARAKKLLAEGVVGTLLSARIRNATPGPDWAAWFFSRDRVGGGVVLQLGVHGIDLVQHLLGPIADVSARTETLLPERRLADGSAVRVENPDSAWAVYGLRRGVVASHEMSMVEASGCDRFRLELYGSEGTIWLRSERGRLAVWAKGRGDAWEAPALGDEDPGRHQHDRWLDGLTGEAPPERTAEDALHGLEVAEAIAASSMADGRRVPIGGS